MTRPPTPPLPMIGWGIAALLPLGFLTLFFIWPVLTLIITGFISPPPGDAHHPPTLDFSGFTEAMSTARTWKAITHTLTQASLATLLALTLGIPAAYVLYRLTFRGRTLLRGIMTIPFVMPTVVVAVAFTSLLGPGSPLHPLGFDQSLPAIVLALAFFNVTVVTRTVGGFWGQLDERQAHAAASLGAGRVRVWCTVTLPQLIPAITSAAALVFLFCATSFGVVLVLGGRAYSNIETEIYRLTVQFLDLRQAAVLSLVQFGIVALTLLISQRLRRHREPAVAMRVHPKRPRKQDLAPVIVFALTLLMLHLLPILTLILRSFRSSEGEWTLTNYRALIWPPEHSPLNGSVFDAVCLSFTIATIATTIALLLGVLLALLMSRRPRSKTLRRLIRAGDALVMLPLGVSAVTLGFGLLLTMNRPLGVGFDLRTQVVLIPIAQALVALPLVLRTILPVLSSIDPKLQEAAATLGASPVRVLATIDMPMVARSVGLATGFAFATSLGEFGASAFLVRPESQTLPVVIAKLISHQEPGSFEAGLAAAVVLGGITSTIMLIAERLRLGTASQW